MPPDQASPSRTALVVLGMHRSGTSALAGVLGHMGCDLPKDLMPATEANAKGHFESLKVFHLNDDLLASAGSSWDDWAAFDDEWYLSPRYPEFRERAAEVLAEEFGSSGLIVLKDPRICRLLPFWKQVLRDAGFRPLFACIHRSPSEVAASLARRDGWPDARGQLLWLRHILDAEAGTRQDARIFVSYDALLADWRTTVQRIATGLDLHLPRSLETAAPAVEEFLSAELRHFRPGSDPGTDAPTDWIRDARAILDRWAVGPEAAGDRAALDALRAEVERTLPALDMLARALEDRTRIEDLRNRLAAETAARADLAGELDRMRQAHAEVDARLAQAAAQLEGIAHRFSEGLFGQLANLQEQLTHKHFHVADLERHAGGLESRLAEALSQLAERDGRIADLEAQRAEMLTSTSWKITRPMRVVARGLRGGTA